MDFSKRGTNYLRESIFVGLVEENVDPNRKGRLKVRVQSVFDNIELEHLPWASPYKDLAGKNFSVPAVGKIVNVIFPHGNLYEPYYIYAEKFNINLFNKLDGLSDDEYKNFVALLFDHRTQIYSDDSELRLDYLYNQVKIKKDGINLHLKDNNQKLKLGHDDADQSAVLGDHWMEWFDEFMNTLLQPQSMLGNFGAPVLKPQIDQVILKYQSLRQTFLSKHVKIVDNASCTDNGDQREDNSAEDDIVEINNEKLLESNSVSPEVKDKVEEQRQKEAENMEESKPDPEDAQNPEQAEGDGELGDDNYPGWSVTKTVPVDDRVKDLELDPSSQALLNKNNKFESRSKTQTQMPVISDPYDDYWVGSSTSKEKLSEPTNDPNYGQWSTKLPSEGTSGGDSYYNVSKSPDKSLTNGFDISTDSLISLYKSKGYTIRKDSEINIFAIRSKDKTTNQFNDIIGCWTKDGKILYYCAATTKPGSYWLQNFDDPRGAIIIKEGQYDRLYKFGMHQGKYKSLVQSGPVDIWRDNNGDNIIDLTTEYKKEQNIGIDIHSTRKGDEKFSNVNKWSAGCQVIQIWSDFECFMTHCLSTKQFDFDYALFNETDFTNDKPTKTEPKSVDYTGKMSDGVETYNITKGSSGPKIWVILTNTEDSDDVVEGTPSYSSSWDILVEEIRINMGEEFKITEKNW